MRMFLLLIANLLPSTALSCGLALVLAVDVSGSVDGAEYRTQMEGLAAALRDGTVMDALIDQRAQVTLVQWSGSSRQEQTLPWRAMASVSDVMRMADDMAGDTRRWRNYSTALGEALLLSVRAFDQVPDCTRRVIDVSGDGASNEGATPASVHPLLKSQGITVNAVVIETGDDDLTGYFYEKVITGPGAFVVTADGFADYPAQIRRKLRRETTRQLSGWPE